MINCTCTGSKSLLYEALRCKVKSHTWHDPNEHAHVTMTQAMIRSWFGSREVFDLIMHYRGLS